MHYVKLYYKMHERDRHYLAPKKQIVEHQYCSEKSHCYTLKMFVEHNYYYIFVLSRKLRISAIIICNLDAEKVICPLTRRHTCRLELSVSSLINDRTQPIIMITIGYICSTVSTVMTFLNASIAIYRDDLVLCRLLQYAHVVDTSVVKLQNVLVSTNHRDADGGGGREYVVTINSAIRHLDDQLVARFYFVVKTSHER